MGIYFESEDSVFAKHGIGDGVGRLVRVEMLEGIVHFQILLLVVQNVMSVTASISSTYSHILKRFTEFEIILKTKFKRPTTCATSYKGDEC